METAILAAGCFWGVQYYFDQVPGVIKTTVGYCGGYTKDPTYEEVVFHHTGYAEAVLIEFDTSKLSYKTLVIQFFRMHDPTQLNRQGPDVGDMYRSAIFYLNREQKHIAEIIRDEIQLKINKKVVTQLVPATKFYQAEPYHQKFTEKTGLGMCHIPYKPV
jgi:methionine-S-sulfoxide reductase